VLRTLPSSAQRRVPFRLRHRALTVLLVLVVVIALAGGAVWLATRTHHGTGHLAAAAPAQSVPVSLCQSCAHDYDPLGDHVEDPGTVGNVVDRDPSTYWQTESYYSGSLQKPGVGVYLDASPGVQARKIEIDTPTPGWNVEIYARDTPPPVSLQAGSWPDGWTRVGALNSVQAKSVISLVSSAKYVYYLVWITQLPPHSELVRISELTLDS